MAQWWWPMANSGADGMAVCELLGKRSWHEPKIVCVPNSQRLDLRRVRGSLSWNKNRNQTTDAICIVRIWNALWFLEGPTLWESFCKLEILVTYRDISGKSSNESPWKIAIEHHWTIVTGLGWEHLGHPAKPSPTWLAEVPHSLTKWCWPSDIKWIHIMNHHESYQIFVSSLMLPPETFLMICEGLNGHLLESSSDNWTWTFEDGRRSSAMERPLHKI